MAKEPSSEAKQKIGKEMLQDMALKVRQGQVPFKDLPKPLQPLVKQELKFKNDMALTMLARQKQDAARRPKMWGRGIRVRRVVG